MDGTSLIDFKPKMKTSYLHMGIIRMIKSRRMRWAGHVARMDAYRILVGQPEGNIYHWEDRDVGWPTMYLRDIGWDFVDWIYLAQVRDHWRALVNTVMNIRIP
jgi:hypothetical protein